MKSKLFSEQAWKKLGIPEPAPEVRASNFFAGGTGLHTLTTRRSNWTSTIPTRSCSASTRRTQFKIPSIAHFAASASSNDILRWKHRFASDLQEFHQVRFTGMNPHAIYQKKSSPAIDQILAPSWRLNFEQLLSIDINARQFILPEGVFFAVSR